MTLQYNLLYNSISGWREMERKKIALMYDFDKTLSDRYMQEYYLLPNIMEISKEDFWNQKKMFTLDKEIDPTLAYLYFILKKAKEKNIKITRELLEKSGENVEFYPGVESWFERINKYGLEKGIKVEHYIISSGMKEIIEGTKIAKYFKRIYACEFYYDENGEAEWLAAAINFTNKTQFVFRINKGALEIYDEKGVNKYVPKEQRETPFTNMVYIGDGDTDIPCMKIIKAKGGKAIAVYEDEKSLKEVKEIFDLGRINLYAKADYQKDSELDVQVKKIIDEIADT